MKRKVRDFSVIIERDEGGWLVESVPQLLGCHTQAKTPDKLMLHVREAIEVCLAAEEQRPDTCEFVGVQRIAV